MATFGFLPRTLQSGGERSRYQVYVPATPRGAPLPVILFLHGSGERGDDGAKQTTVGLGNAVRAYGDSFPAIVVFPQARAGESWRGPMGERAMRALDATLAELPCDGARVYLTGISLGGSGAWHLALEHPRRFAALAPVCGWLDPSALPATLRARGGSQGDAHDAAARALRHLPVWVFHGAADAVVPVERSRLMVDALRRAGADVRYTEYPGVGHDSWNRAYAEPELVPWMLAHAGTG